MNDKNYCSCFINKVPLQIDNKIDLNQLKNKCMNK